MCTVSRHISVRALVGGVLVAGGALLAVAVPALAAPAPAAPAAPAPAAPAVDPTSGLADLTPAGVPVVGLVQSAVGASKIIPN
jgi:hypothetical protein